jgi:hypothetical protein
MSCVDTDPYIADALGVGSGPNSSSGLSDCIDGSASSVRRCDRLEETDSGRISLREKVKVSGTSASIRVLARSGFLNS